MPSPASDALRPPGRAWPDAVTVTGGAGAVATTDRFATDVGLRVLRSGGNAMDATVAAALALAVVNPEAGNVGGGGFLLLRTADGRIEAQDHRSTAPAAASADMFEGAAPDASEVGHLSVAVPGTVRGLHDAWERHGSRPWAELVEPAVELARGFEVTHRLIRSYHPHIVEGLERFESSAAVFLPGGQPPREGEFFRQDELATTLTLIRDEGPDGFYRGAVADAIVAEMERGGGVLARKDLESYRPVWREPVRVRYRGRTVVSMPPPSAGGVALAGTCHILAGHDPAALGFHEPAHVHLLAEAWRRVYADRNVSLADPDFADVPVALLTSPEYGAWRGRDIDPRRATPSVEVAGGLEAYRSSTETTHLSVVDARGMAVALTTTINTWYGSKLVVPGTGVLLNNTMDDFTLRPGEPNHFGLVQGAANALAPGKRPLSAMTPTLVLDADGALELVLGTPGGSTITTTVFQVISNVVDHGMALDDAVTAPRVHHQHLPDTLRYEPGGLPARVVGALEAMGHALEVRDAPSGDVMAVRLRPDGGREAVADPRRGGVADAY